jgi:hypothetical protein
MKHSALSSLSVLSLLIGTLSLVGCGGAFDMPDSTGSPAEAAATVPGPPIQGSVFGGHAPIQGAHVYLAQPGTTGYGSAATSLLGSGTTTTPGGFPLHTNAATGTDPNVPAGAQYVITDANGEFNLTNAYVCTVGQPVYIYAYGGNIGTTPTTTPTTVTLTVTNATANRVGGVTTYTFTAANTNAVPLAAGNTVTLAITGNPGSNNWNNLPASETVATATSTGFTVTSATNRNITGTAKGTAAYTFNATGTNPATQNDNIVELATLGNCPSSGNFSTAGNGALSFIYLNEVSTVATAYTFQPFTLVTNNDAWHIGFPATKPAFPVTVPATTVPNTQALLGIVNAANTAAQLYNIQGGTNISSSGDGEGHLANSQTAALNGIVPEATLDALANIIAACVDTVPTTVGTPTTQCAALFGVATDDGTTTGTQPVDTATAVINIARYPAGNSSSANVNTNYVHDLYVIPTGTVPYVPTLVNQPHDWTVAINYPVSSSAYFTVSNNAFALAESVEVDGNGQIWVTGQTNFSIIRMNSLGVISPPTAANNLGYIPGYVSVDGGNNAWTGNANTTSPIFEAGSNGIFTATFGTANQFGKAYVNIADNAGDDFFFASTATTGGNFQMFEYPVGSTPATTPTQFSISPSTFPAGDNIAHGAIDANGDFWLTTETSFQIAKLTNTGTKVWSKTVNQQPEFPAIDNNGTGWIPGYEADEVYKITSAGTQTTLTSASTGAALVFPFGAAVDGNGNVWITNRCGPGNVCGNVANSRTLVEINGTGTNGTINTAISPPTNFLPEAQYPATAGTFTAIMPDPLNVAIDPSGNIWITNYNNGGISSVTEIVGTAAPVTTPLSAAAGALPTNKLGAKP